MKMEPPCDIETLLKRAHALYQLSLGKLSEQLQMPLPQNTRHGKGFVGQLLEKALGATSGNRPEPDFNNLGVELKTIPVNLDGRPLESTFICSAQLTHAPFHTFETSLVYQKLKHVLWIPIITQHRQQSVAERTIGKAILWQPSTAELETLRLDFEELMEMICLGQLAQITARHGTYLQLRPKGANSRVLCKAVGECGEPIVTMPRGFYLRTSFTQRFFCYTAAMK